MGCLHDDVSITPGLPQIAAELLQCSNESRNRCQSFAMLDVAVIAYDAFAGLARSVR